MNTIPSQAARCTSTLGALVRHILCCQKSDHTQNRQKQHSYHDDRLLPYKVASPVPKLSVERLNLHHDLMRVIYSQSSIRDSADTCWATRGCQRGRDIEAIVDIAGRIGMSGVQPRIYRFRAFIPCLPSGK
jgi:hypothetical protein